MVSRPRGRGGVLLRRGTRVGARPGLLREEEGDGRAHGGALGQGRPVVGGSTRPSCLRVAAGHSEGFRRDEAALLR
ncbi:unknown protein [Oryza sativa Japonica Group]|uniref:Os01g0711900 protein n=1 Tax=Oryza sativa subsp. japonica TaxID=39947 RepID=Q5NAH2_ORYSJ|nr:unknown protein [Oryza sativa Japonica Group]BAD82269.1 unknown protein [Oryza sativa Japonica Group]BAH91265.1 Os01g0711900 [Oryza sativa Japonica Group]|eukprot:NP_001172535.1 Os01g0711900 [Oryza sativa Japonica Group]